MVFKSSDLNPRRSAFRRLPLLLRLLLTAVWTALVVSAGLYTVKKILEHPGPAPGVEAKVIAEPVKESPPLPPPEPAAIPAGQGGSAGSLAMVKKGKLPEDEPSARDSAATIPRLRPSGGFPGNRTLMPAPSRGETAFAPARRISGEAVALSVSDLSRKLKVKGSGPVSETLAKRYSGIDPEAEKLRLNRLGEEEAAAATRGQLRHEQRMLIGLIALLTIFLTVAGSRVISALRLMETIQETHWTLK